MLFRSVQSTSLDVAIALIRPSLGTIDHIKPKALGGKSNKYNYVWTDQDCNNRKKHTLLAEFIHTEPQIVKNIQNYFDFFIQQLNNGRIKGLVNYLHNVAKTIDTETRGEITPDLNRLRKAIPDYYNGKHRYNRSV